jgi:DNA-binding response OmpR family regulator
MTALIVLVMADARARRQMETLLGGERHLVAALSDFASAKELLRSVGPDLLVADVKLGAFNGLHVAARARLDHPNVPIIITHDAHDAVLEAEAARLGAVFVVRPLEDPKFLALVESLLGDGAPAATRVRRWSRKRPATGIEALAADKTVHILDLSYGGMKLGLSESPDQLPKAFEIRVPEAGVSVRANQIWRSSAPLGAAPDTFLCGVELVDTAAAESSAWRALVESLY